MKCDLYRLQERKTRETQKGNQQKKGQSNGGSQLWSITSVKKMESLSENPEKRNLKCGLYRLQVLKTRESQKGNQHKRREKAMVDPNFGRKSLKEKNIKMESYSETQ